MTLAEVAQHAGVSAKTASQALQHGRGAPATVAKIKTVAETLGYKIRQTKRTAKIRAVLVVTPLEFNPSYYIEFATAVRDRLRAKGLETLYRNGGGHDAIELAAIDEAIRDGVAGAILVSPRCLPAGAERLVRSRIPTVVVTARPNEIPPEVSRVHVDNSQGVYAAVTYLREIGHERIAYLCGPALAYSEEQRRDGFVQAMQNSNARIRQEYIIHLNEPSFPDYRAGYNGFKALLRISERPTAIIAFNDMMALGCLNAAYESCITVPEKISIVGHDDLPFAEYTIPPLTTITINRQRLGAYAVEQLCKLIINYEDSSEITMETRHDLIKRGTVGSIW